MGEAVLSKAKGETFIGFFASESDPPTHIEFVTALQFMANCLLDNIAYVVIDGHSSDDYYEWTRKHRVALAKIMTSAFQPLIELADLPGDRGTPTADVAFQLFGLNPGLEFTLVFLSTEGDQGERDRIVERVVGSVGMRLFGFDPQMHKVAIVFGAAAPRIPYEWNASAKHFVERGLISVGYTELDPVPLPSGKNIWSLLLEGIKGDPTGLALLHTSVYKYINEHSEYRERLLARLANEAFKHPIR